MSTVIDLYWSFRSPYSYLATQNIRKIETARDVTFNLKIVLPLAIRDPSFFDSRGTIWLGYVMRDIMRLAQMTEQPLAMPNPDQPKSPKTSPIFGGFRVLVSPRPRQGKV